MGSVAAHAVAANAHVEHGGLARRRSTIAEATTTSAKTWFQPSNPRLAVSTIELSAGFTAGSVGG